MDASGSETSIEKSIRRRSCNQLPRIPYYIVDDHNEALHCIYRAIGRQRLPFSGLTLLHYDSHPDLCIPNIPPSTILSDSRSVIRAVSIEDWILPAVYAQYIDTVIWIKPEWSKQMEARPLTEYHIGPLKSNPNMLCVTCPDSYFVEDGSHAALEELDNPIKFKFAVEWLHPMHTACKPCQDLMQYLRGRPFILDIDMDTFTCVNPLRRKFTLEQAEMIDKLYGPGEDSHDLTPSQLSSRQRDNYHELGEWINLIKHCQPLPLDNPRALMLHQLCISVKGAAAVMNGEGDCDDEDDDNGGGGGGGDVTDDGEESFSYLHYLWKGGWDQSETGLPHQVNNMQQIMQYIEAMESMINRLENPKLITISRSHKDGYIPERHVDILEKVVIKSLEQVYGKRLLRPCTPYSQIEAAATSTQQPQEDMQFQSLSSTLRDNQDMGDNALLPKKGIH